MKLLLVEDDQDLAHWLMQSLVGCGFQVDWSEDGRTAEQRIAREDYDLILLDLGLPLMSGAELLARLKAGGERYAPDGDDRTGQSGAARGPAARRCG